MTLKPDFDLAYDRRTALDFDAPESPRAVALRMLAAEEVYWEHYGWLEACTKAICEVASTGDYSTAQAMAQWLYARLPKGADRMPSTKTLVEYAQAQFPYDEINRMSTMLNVMEADGLI